MTPKQFICTKCKTQKRACTFSPGGDRLPMICGWDGEGYMLKPEWMEVPEKPKEEIQLCTDPHTL